MPFTSRILRPINQCNLTDLENHIRTHDSSLSMFRDKQGRIRLIKFVNGYAVSGLFLEKYGKTGYIIAGVYTVLGERRKGHAKELFTIAKKRLKRIRHNDNLSSLGELWAYSVEGIA